MHASMLVVTRSCWCGANSLEEFGPDYLLCTSCETLVGQAGLTDEATLVHDDDVDYYGKQYWLEHQGDVLGLPDVYARVRQDLPERCAHWLKALLRYQQPPGMALEIGAGHGAYTALLRWAGYDATALDLSAWVAEFARARFGIPYIVGPIEEQDLKPRSFDVVIANDVLEHLADPVGTMRHCADLLKPAGTLVIQTPEYSSGHTYDELLAAGDLFLKHMDAATEHLYLFSRKGLQQLLETLGLGEVSFEEPVYSYDMLCIASATPLRPVEFDPDRLAAASTTGPLVLSLIDAHDAWLEARDELQASEQDRTERLEAIVRLDAALQESEADRQARLAVIETLDAALKKSDADRQARLAVIERLDAALRESNTERDRD
jgi:2-polyprenyl-3-methyl-5-hydroxy-6-metoxy-1,4-benzoquinol methylase